MNSAKDAFGRLPLLLAFSLGSLGLLVLGVQPLLYSAFVHEGLVSEARVGFLASTEIAAIAVGSLIGIALLRRVNQRFIAVGGFLLLILFSLMVETVPLFAARALTGLGGGLLVAVAAFAIADQARVNRVAGAFLLLQNIGQYAALKFLSGQAAALSGTQILYALTCLYLIAVPFCLLLPKQAVKRISLETAEVRGAPPLAGIVALVASALLVGAIIGIWAYMGLWLEQRGIDADQVAGFLSACMLGQMAGALTAMWIGERGHSGRRILTMSGLMLLIVYGLYVSGDDAELLFYLVIAFGLVWMITTPALTGLALDVDPSRRSLPYVAGAQLAGAAIIPTLTGEIFASHGLDLVIAVSGVTVLASLGIVALAVAMPKAAMLPVA